MNKCRENRFRKGMAVLLSAVLLVVTVLGGRPSEVHAEEDAHVHNGVTYQPWDRSDSLPTEAGNWYLTKDVTLTKQWVVPVGPTNLCLNGKTIVQSGDLSDLNREKCVFWIGLSHRLNLYDCAGGGKLTVAYTEESDISNWNGVFNYGTFYMYGGQISGIKGAGIANHGTFHMYGGEICHNDSKYFVGGVGNSGVFYMYGGKIFANTAEWFFGGVDNSNIFHMYGGEISGNIGGYGGVSFSEKNSGTLELGAMLVGGSAVISGNKDWNGVEKNVYIRRNVIISGGRIIIDSDNPLSGGARIGITTQSKPTAQSPIQLTGKLSEDYSRYFYSDDEKYTISDSVNHAGWLVPKGEHKQHVIESWSHDDDNHWKQCLLCGEKSQEAAHVFDDWVTDSEATDTEDGEKHRECSVCSFQETEVIPATRPTAPPTPSPTPVPTATPTPVPTPTVTPPAKEEPSATPKPVATHKPTEDPKPVATKKPSEPPTPPATKKPSATEKPTEAPKPEATEKPSEPSTPPATKEPSPTPKPAVTEQPPATKEPSPPPKPAATEQPPATAKPEATKEPSATPKPTATKQPPATSKPAETVRPGTIRLEIEVKGNAPDIRVSTSAEEMADRILTEKDRKELENGQDIGMYVVVTDISGSVSQADRSLAEAASTGYATWQYMDISLYKEVGGERIQVTGPLAGNISLTLSVPDGLKNTDRTKTREYAVVRVHSGEASMLPDGDSDADTITIDTDRFSTYEIVYKDTVVGSNTGSNQNNAGSPNEVSPTGVPGSAGETVNSSHNGGNTNVSSEKKSESGSSKNTRDKSDSKNSKDSRDKKSGGSTAGHTRDGEPKTGDETAFELTATLAMVSGLSYVLLYFLERRHGMTEEAKKEITARIIAWAKRGGRLRKGMAIAAICVFLVYYHSIGKEIGEEWREAYDE